MTSPKKIRLDQLLVERGLVETRSKAQALIMAGSVRVAGDARVRAGDMLALDAAVEVTAGLPYASRGGHKLAHALDAFALNPVGLVAADIGASTGGFTDVLLQRGAAHVFAVDVGYGLLDYRLRADVRVTAIDRTNVRYLESLPGGVLADCGVIDTAFISLKLVLPAVRRLVAAHGWVVALIKPQFEAGADQVGKGGVVRDPAVHAAVLRSILGFAPEAGFVARGLARSPITGPAGNIEFLGHFDGSGEPLDIAQAIRMQSL